jgi:hypothetical protein
MWELQQKPKINLEYLSNLNDCKILLMLLEPQYSFLTFNPLPLAGTPHPCPLSDHSVHTSIVPDRSIRSQLVRPAVVNKIQLMC